MSMLGADGRRLERDATVELPPVWALLVIGVLSLLSWAAVILIIVAAHSVL